MSKKPKITVPEVVTKAIISATKRTNLPAWFSGIGNRLPLGISPMQALGKRRYTAVNKLLTQSHMMEHDFSSPYYLTRKKIFEMGGSIKESHNKNYCLAVGVFPVFKDENGKITKDESKAKTKTRAVRYWYIYNIEQTEGLDLSRWPTPKMEKVKHDPIVEIEAILKRYLDWSGVKVERGKPSFWPSKDTIKVLGLDDYKKVFNYYLTYFHEVGHSTGTESRLNRKGITKNYKFGSKEYGYEELVAELTAAMCMTAVGFDPKDMDNSAAYIKGWLKVLESNPDWIIKASYEAEKAFAMICPDHVDAPYTPKDKEETKKPKAKKKTAKKKTAKTKTSTADLDKALADLQKQMEDLLKIKEEVTANH